jgi:phosphoribosylanthranilate isomerase
MKIKVCGMKEPQNIADVVALGVDYIGFIFYEQSPRCICPTPTPLPKGEGEKVQKVGVFVNHSIGFILDKISAFGLDLVQLHGHETVDFCKELKQALLTVETQIGTFGNGYKMVKIIKVFSVGDYFDFTQLIDYKPFIDYFLFDTKGKNLGGNGITFDWSILKNYDNEVPFFLSGGIDIQHVEEIKALKNLNIHALDINSKFEISAGFKNVEKIEQFLISF